MKKVEILYLFIRSSENVGQISRSNTFMSVKSNR